MATRHLRFAVLACLLLAALISGACTRSASTPPASAVPGEETPQAENWQQQTMEAVRFALLTQTAQAASGEATTPAVTPTATVVAPLTPGATAVSAATPTAPAPTVPAVVLPTSTPLVRPTTYTLQEGEFPYCIARRFNVNPGELLRINGLTSYSVYYAGMDLRIPQSGGGFPGSRALRPHPASYTVRPGDTIYTIACAFGDVDPAMIAYVNNLGGNVKPSPGSVINIP